MIQKALAMTETKNYHTPTIRAHGLEIFASRFKIVGLGCLVRAEYGTEFQFSDDEPDAIGHSGMADFINEMGGPEHGMLCTLYFAPCRRGG